MMDIAVLRGLLVGRSIGTLNSTQLTSEPLFENVQQEKAATITIGSFDIAISIIMMGSILWDTYSAVDVSSDADSCTSPKWFRLVHPAEMFPFFVSVVTLFQGGVFVGIQSSVLQSYTETQCRTVAEVIWPGTVWLFPLTVLVFGLETSLRSLGRDRFHARGRWNIVICVGAIAILTLALWLSAYLVPTGNECVGAMIMYTSDYAKTATVLASAMIFIHLLLGSVITVQLLSTAKMDKIERIMATRVVCTQYISILILACTLPYYIQAIGNDASPSTISRMADIAVNLAGILNALLHLFLRTNSYRIAIRSAEALCYEKRALRLLGPTDFDLGTVISTPLLLDPRNDPSLGANSLVYHKQDNTAVRQSRAKSLPRLSMIGRSSSLRQAKSGPVGTPLTTQASPLTSPITPLQQSIESKSQQPMFPAQGLSPQGPERPIGTIEEDQVVALPAPLFASRHRRKFFDQGSETVQIGLRLSHTLENRNPESLRSRQISTSSKSSLPSRQLSESSWDRTNTSRSSYLRRQPSDESLIIPSRLKEPPLPVPRSPSLYPRSKYSTQLKHSQRATTKSLPPIPVMPPSRVMSSLYEEPPSAEPSLPRDREGASSAWS